MGALQSRNLLVFGVATRDSIARFIAERLQTAEAVAGKVIEVGADWSSLALSGDRTPGPRARP
ncbi:MAG: hypothetical protein HYX54_04075 [Chloroflexi bacterium]|nr:hypothetical protein [Chloroflexota bacterium]